LLNETQGYGRDALQNGTAFGGTQTVSLRGAVKTEITPNLTWLVRGDYQRQSGNAQSVTSVVAETVTPEAAANWSDKLGGLVPALGDTYDYNLHQLTGGGLRDRQFGI